MKAIYTYYSAVSSLITDKEKWC